MKVHVEGDIYITSDERQFIICRQTFQINKETGETKEVMVPVTGAYHTNLHACINALVKRKLHESTATTLRELLEDLKRIRLDIEANVLI